MYSLLMHMEETKNIVKQILVSCNMFPIMKKRIVRIIIIITSLIGEKGKKEVKGPTASYNELISKK